MEAQVRRTKIIAMLGPATDAPGMLRQILADLREITDPWR